MNAHVAPAADLTPDHASHAAAQDMQSWTAVRGDANDVTFALAGVFDGASAWDLRHAIESVEVDASQVVLDFSKVREFYDFGVAVLAHALSQRDAGRPAIALKGLRTHQARMFKYFGVSA